MGRPPENARNGPSEAPAALDQFTRLTCNIDQNIGQQKKTESVLIRFVDGWVTTQVNVISSASESASDSEPPLRSKAKPAKKVDADFFVEQGLNVDREELEQLLAPPPSKRFMRMRADDEQEEVERKRLVLLSDGLSSV